MRITTLRAAAGPGIELLEYLTLRDGRSLPADTRANDLVHWQTLLWATDAFERPQALLDGRALLVSPGVVATPDAVLGFRAGLLARDPDGHAAQFRLRELPR